MSHSLSEVWTDDGLLVGYFEYNGTVDVCCTRVQRAPEGVSAHWRSEGNSSACSCAGSGQPVVLYTTYGGGFYWSGRVCWNCMAITEGIIAEDTCDGRPFPTRAENGNKESVQLQLQTGEGE